MVLIAVDAHASVANVLRRSTVAHPMDRSPDLALRTLTLKSVSGHVYDENGVALQGATVVLFAQNGNVVIASTTTGSQGEYSFDRRSDDTRDYYTVAFAISGGVAQIHGVSDRGLRAQ